jgi:cyclohexanecarboxylate-CoA ligase
MSSVDQQERSIATLRPAETAVKRNRALGTWRAVSALDDLVRWSQRTPGAVAIIAREADGHVVRLTYQEYANYLERFAGALHELGVGHGDVVAVQLPNRWQVSVLLLACAKIGAIIAPIMPSVRTRELERVLNRVDAKVFLTVDSWDSRFFEQTAWETTHAGVLKAKSADPDRVALVLFTSGTSGEPKATLHTLNTLYAIHSAVLDAEELDEHTTFFTPHASTHSAGINIAILMPLLAGGTSVLMDAWNPDAAVGFLAEAEVNYLLGAPIFLTGLMDALARQSVDLPLIRTVTSTATAIPANLITRVPEVFGVSLRSIWSMTEGASVFVRPGDPADWAGYSIGRPGPGTEIDLRADQPVSDERPAKLFIRGAAVCLATLGRDSGELNVLAEHDHGWFDTGDLAVPDERGGIRLMGRATDRIGGVFMIPANDVESALLGHPAVREVTLVGYPDGQGGELACAVVVCHSAMPTLDDLRTYLLDLGMTDWYLPSRLELVSELPRNASGKVRKELLRRQLSGVAESTAGGLG